MVIFHSYVSLPEGIILISFRYHPIPRLAFDCLLLRWFIAECVIRTNHTVCFNTEAAGLCQNMAGIDTFPRNCRQSLASHVPAAPVRLDPALRKNGHTGCPTLSMLSMMTAYWFTHSACLGIKWTKTFNSCSMLRCWQWSFGPATMMPPNHNKSIKSWPKCWILKDQWPTFRWRPNLKVIPSECN